MLKKLALKGGLMAHWNPEYETRMETDCSDGVAGGQLLQLQLNKVWRLVAFFSSTLNPSEMNYDIHDKEMLAIVKGLREWRGLLIGVQNPFLAITDHRALEYFTTKRQLTGRQARWAELISEYDFKITYRPGKQNTIADILSRKEELVKTQKEKRDLSRTQCLLDPARVIACIFTSDRVVAPIEFTDLSGMSLVIADLTVTSPDQQPEEEVIEAPATAEAAETPAGVEDYRNLHPYQIVDQVLQANRSDPTLEEYRERARSDNPGDWSLNQDLLLHKRRLYVPDQDFLRTKVVYMVHSLPTTAHPGKTKTMKLVAERYYWPKMAEFANQFTLACRECSWTNQWTDKTPGLLKPLPVGERLWQHVAFDFKKMPKSKNGYDNMFLMVDRFGKRAITRPCHANATAKDAARYYYESVWRYYGTPDTATSDRGSQFVSDFTNELCKLTRVKQNIATTGHAQTDGQSEILNKIYDQRLRPFVSHFQDDWDELLPAMDLAHAILPHETTGISPYELELGQKPRLPFNWEERTKKFNSPQEKLSRTAAQAFAKRNYKVIEWARNNILKNQKIQERKANRHRREPDFGPGDMVYVSRQGWLTDRPSVKLDRRNAGPYKIEKMKGHSYELKLPDYMKMHNVFHADRLRKAKEPVPGQVLTAEPEHEVDGEPEWLVDKILASRIYQGKLQYKADWTGCDPDDQFYDAESYINSPERVREFHEQYPDAAGPPARLEIWREAARRDERLPPCPEDNLAVQKGTRYRTRRRPK